MESAHHRVARRLVWLVLLIFGAACAPTPTPLAATPAAPGGATQTVTDALGNPVAVPVAPQRIVAQDFLGELLAVGLTPVGTSDRFYDESDLFTAYLSGVERIGEANTPSVEKILALKPDLILVNQYLEENLLEQLAQIAPTILFDDNQEAVARLTAVAEVVGKQAEAQTWIDNYTEQQADVREQLSSVIVPGEKALILTTWEDIIWVQATRSIGHTIYTTLGFSPTDKIKAEVEAIMSGANTGGQSGYLEISLEVLPDYAADADRLFVLVSSDEKSQASFQTLQDNPLWQSLPAVQNDQVYRLSSGWGWYNPIGLAWELTDSVRLLGESQ